MWIHLACYSGTVNDVNDVNSMSAGSAASHSTWKWRDGTSWRQTLCHRWTLEGHGWWLSGGNGNLWLYQGCLDKGRKPSKLMALPQLLFYLHGHFKVEGTFPGKPFVRQVDGTCSPALNISLETDFFSVPSFLLFLWPSSSCSIFAVIIVFLLLGIVHWTNLWLQ